MVNCTRCDNPVEPKRAELKLTLCYACAEETTVVLESTPLGLRPVSARPIKTAPLPAAATPKAKPKRWHVVSKVNNVDTAFDTLEEAMGFVNESLDYTIVDRQRGGLGRVWPTPGLRTRKTLHPVSTRGGGARRTCLNRYELRT